MEIYTNSADRTVVLDVPITLTNVTATLVRGDTTLHTFNTVSGSAGRYTVVLPFAYVQNDDELQVLWTYSYTEDGQTFSGSRRTHVSVVTPYLTTPEIEEIAEGALSPAEIITVEKAVRHIINAHTGQSFGRYVGKKLVRGTSGKALALPVRLIELKSVNGDTNMNNYLIDGDGYYLKHFAFGVPPVKADFHGYHMHVGGVIHNPNSVKLEQFNATPYEIDGVWGWESVPQAIKEAAKLLVHDYACADTNYRDRYLTSMTAADWRIQFNSGAFAMTGNVRADQLLSEYVLKRGWAVL